MSASSLWSQESHGALSQLAPPAATSLWQLVDKSPSSPSDDAKTRTSSLQEESFAKFWAHEEAKNKNRIGPVRKSGEDRTSGAPSYSDRDTTLTRDEAQQMFKLGEGHNASWQHFLKMGREILLDTLTEFYQQELGQAPKQPATWADYVGWIHKRSLIGPDFFEFQNGQSERLFAAEGQLSAILRSVDIKQGQLLVEIPSPANEKLADHFAPPIYGPQRIRSLYDARRAMEDFTFSYKYFFAPKFYDELAEQLLACTSHSPGQSTGFPFFFHRMAHEYFNLRTTVRRWAADCEANQAWAACREITHSSTPNSAVRPLPISYSEAKAYIEIRKESRDPSLESQDWQTQIADAIQLTPPMRAQARRGQDMTRKRFSRDLRSSWLNFVSSSYSLCLWLDKANVKDPAQSLRAHDAILTLHDFRTQASSERAQDEEEEGGYKPPRPPHFMELWDVTFRSAAAGLQKSNL